jgi:hypothetical protein
MEKAQGHQTMAELDVQHEEGQGGHAQSVRNPLTGLSVKGRKIPGLNSSPRRPADTVVKHAKGEARNALAQIDGNGCDQDQENGEYKGNDNRRRELTMWAAAHPMARARSAMPTGMAPLIWSEIQSQPRSMIMFQRAPKTAEHPRFPTTVNDPAIRFTDGNECFTDIGSIKLAQRSVVDPVLGHHQHIDVP